MPSFSRRWLTVAALSALVALAAPPAPASACGGFFCDRGPAMPDAFGNPPPTQAGEEIVYGVESDGSLVMTVRIFYQGVAPEFAWILPVPATPTISLGTDALFAALEGPTQPAFFVSDYQTSGECAPDPTCTFVPRDVGVAAADAGAFFASDAASDGSTGPTIEQMSTLGPYETVVLSGGTGAEVQTWLSDHGYLIPASATPLLDTYASTGSHFVALRLRGDVSVDQIQPVTLTMPATAPCLPIRLTALATQPDLPVTGYFLADGRAVSTNYSMLDLDYADRGLYFGTTSYYSYVTRAADAAGGQAFATDYAGTTPSASLELTSVLDLATETDPAVFLQQLNTRGYLADPQILGLLAQFLVPPDGSTPRSFYNCLIFGSGPVCGTPQSFDPAGAADAIDQRITQPRHDASALLGRHPFTTRLFTTLSAEEMTLDPEFRIDTALGTVDRIRPATLTTDCDPGHYRDEAGDHLTTPSGVVFGTMPARAHVSPSLWCERRGASYGTPGVDGGRYPDGAIAPAGDAGPPLVAAGGAGCAVGTRGAARTWALLIGCAALFALRRRRC